MSGMIEVVIPALIPEPPEIKSLILELGGFACTFEDTGRGAQVGDIVRVAIDARMDGEPFPPATVEDVMLPLGQDVLPGFDHVLLGTRAGEVLEAEFPTVQGQLSARVVVHAVTVRTPPEVTDDLADQILPPTHADRTVDELEDFAQEWLERDHRADARKAVEEALTDALAVRTDEDPPDTWLQSEVDQRMANFAIGRTPTDEERAEQERTERDQLTRAWKAMTAVYEMDREQSLGVTRQKVERLLGRLRRERAKKNRRATSRDRTAGIPPFSALVESMMRDAAFKRLRDEVVIRTESGAEVPLEAIEDV